MKILKQNYRAFLAVTAVCAILMLTGSSPSYADDWGGHYRYYDRDGFWDGYHHYHHYDYYHHHRGYWNTRNGINVWINV